MSKDKKKKDQEPEFGVDISADYKITYMVQLPDRFPNRGGRSGQPHFSDGSGHTSVAYLMGPHTMTHLEALEVYQDALKRETAAREVREYWGEVVTNWHAHSEKVEGGDG